MDTTKLRESASNVLAAAAKRYALQSTAIDRLETIELPIEARVEPHHVYVTLWNGYTEYTVIVELDQDLSYQDRIKPIGATLRAFKARNVRRDVDNYGSVRFYADSGIGDDCHVVVVCGQGAISPACTIETVTEVVTETREVTTVKVTCPEPASV